jgi:hypothetical protein
MAGTRGTHDVLMAAKWMTLTIVNALREIKGEKCIMGGYWRLDESEHTS